MAAGGAAAAAAAIAQAIKASGAVVRVAPDEFLKIANRVKEPLIVMGKGGGLFGRRYKYLVSYKGLVFFTNSPYELVLQADAELMPAEKIWVPG